MLEVTHIIGPDTDADMLAQVRALARKDQEVVSIGPRPGSMSFDRKTVQIRVPLNNGVLAGLRFGKLRPNSDLIHAWSHQAASAARWAPGRKPVVLSLGHLHNLHQADVAISGCFDGLWALTVPTDSQRQVLINLGLDPTRVFVLPPVARIKQRDLGQRNRTRSILGVDEDCFLLAAGGEMNRANGHKQACWAHAMARILTNRIRLVFPSSGPARGFVENFARSTGHQEEIMFTDGRLPGQEVLAGADAAVFLQHRDCGVAPLVRAMSQGLAILASNRPEIADCAPDRQAALLSPPGDMRRATDNLLTLARDADLRKTLGLRARKLAGEKFDPDDVAARIWAIHQTVLSGHS